MIYVCCHGVYLSWEKETNTKSVAGIRVYEGRRPRWKTSGELKAILSSLDRLL